MKADTFLNLSKRQAQNLAENNNLIFRLIKSDGEDFFPYPEDRRDDRVCVELVGGKVAKAVIR